MGNSASSSAACYDSLRFSDVATSYPKSEAHNTHPLAFKLTYDKGSCDQAAFFGSQGFSMNLVSSTGVITTCDSPTYSTVYNFPAVVGAKGTGQYSSKCIPTEVISDGYYQFKATAISENSGTYYTYPLISSCFSIGDVSKISGGCFGPAATPSGDSTMRKRALEARNLYKISQGQSVVQMSDGKVCQSGMVACPVAGRKMWECIDVERNLEVCGACPQTPGWQNCASIPFANSVSCSSGVCKVDSCDASYVSNTTACVDPITGLAPESYTAPVPKPMDPISFSSGASKVIDGNEQAIKKRQFNPKKAESKRRR